MAVVALLTAILFPVFSVAKASAIRTNCLTRFHGVAQATQLYLGDYDDSFMPVNHQPGQNADPKNDSTWVQMLLPYIGSFQTFRCPADSTNLEANEASFDEDLLPGDLSARYYLASMHVNLGYNFQYLAPDLKDNGEWVSEPKDAEALADPSRMLMFIDSAWTVTNGVPQDGGSYLVQPPCRFEQVGTSTIDTIASVPADVKNKKTWQAILLPTESWASASAPDPWYGGVWPWHSGRASTVSVDGSAREMTMAQLQSGCDIRTGGAGMISNRNSYLWAPE